MLLLFWWHSSLPNPPVDLGARTCEFFFVCSGFLVAYNYGYSGMPCTWKQSFHYVKGKLCSMWPMHFAGFLLATLILALLHQLVFDSRTLVKAVINLFLVQSWSFNSEVFFSFNGVSWFLSSILFCYFLSPLLLKSLRNKKTAGSLFVLVLLVRIFLEWQQNYYEPDLLTFNFHVSPFIRCLEFWAGMLMYPFYENVEIRVIKKSNKRVSFLIFSLIELFSVATLIALCFYKEGIWMRGQFVALFCMIVFVFSFEGGILSRLLGTAFFRKFGSIEMEFFIFHQLFINLFEILFANSIQIYFRNLIIFSILLIFCLLWRRFCSKKFKLEMQMFFFRMENFFGSVQEY